MSTKFSRYCRTTVDWYVIFKILVRTGYSSTGTKFSTTRVDLQLWIYYWIHSSSTLAPTKLQAGHHIHNTVFFLEFLKTKHTRV
jgi:hypothetical protein